jgi:asparagine synthase (glutamine-hydrolysing)
MQLGFSVLSREDGQITIELMDEADARASWLLSAEQDGPHVAAVLGLIRPLAQDQNAARLVLECYARGGIDEVCQLAGDFSLVLWDAAAGQLFALRDPMGGFPLFWTLLPRGFALDTSLSRLAAAHGRDTLDRRFLGAFLCASEVHNEELNTKLTAYASIERVPPGDCLSFEPCERRVRRLGSWSWAREAGWMEVRGHQDAAEGVRQRLEHAVRAYLADKTAAHLSGGMDSTGLCALAAHCFGRPDLEPRLHTLSLVYQRFPGLAGETRMIDAALHALHASPHRILADELRPFDALDRVPPHDEPAPPSVWSAGDLAMMEAAAAAECRVILSGSGADFLFDAPPWHLADHLARGRWRRLLVDAAACAEGQNANIRAVLWHQAVLPLITGLPARACRGPVYRGRWPHYDGRRPPPWMRADFLRKHSPAACLHEGEDGRHLSRRSRAALALVKAHQGDWGRWYLGVPRGVTVAYPYLQPQLVAFVLACLERLPPEPGRLKPLLADALSGFLPEAIVRRREKVDYNDVFFTGLGENLARLERLVTLPALADLGILEPRLLLDCLRDTVLGIAPPAPATNRLSRALALALWLDCRALPRSKARLRARYERARSGSPRSS